MEQRAEILRKLMAEKNIKVSDIVKKHKVENEEAESDIEKQL